MECVPDKRLEDQDIECPAKEIEPCLVHRLPCDFIGRLQHLPWGMQGESANPLEDRAGDQ
jgi:hypothetical protein